MKYTLALPFKRLEAMYSGKYIVPSPGEVLIHMFRQPERENQARRCVLHRLTTQS